MLTRTFRLLGLAAISLCAFAQLAGCSANSGGAGSSGTGIPTRLNRTTAPVVSVSVSPVKLNLDGTADATWNTDDATSCKITGNWSGSAPLNDDTDYQLGPFTTPGVYQFGLTCTGPGGTTTTLQSITVGAPPPPTIQFDIIPSEIAPGFSSNLTWSATNATSCTGSAGTGTDGWEGPHATQESAGFNTGVINVQGSYQYVLTCLGAGGSTQVTRILTVSSSAAPPAPTITFSATPALIEPGQTTALSWTTSGASSCAASGGSGDDGWTGAQATASASTVVGPVVAAGVYSYTLTCTGSGGSVAKSITLDVSTSAIPPAISVDINVTPRVIVAGSSANLTWVTANATACSASGSWSGPQPVLGTAVSTGTLNTAGTYSYTLTCTGVGGSNSGTAILTVEPAPAVVTALAAVPPVITAGQTTYLTWLSTDATSCKGTGGASGDGWAGPQPAEGAAVAFGPINTAGTYIYTLQCSGPGGTSTPRSVSVTVESATPQVAQVTAFAAAPSTIVVGQASSLSWATLGASSCLASGGTGSDGWNGSVGTASAGTSTGPISTAGSYTYVLTCTGPGGAAQPSSVVVNVVPATSTSAIVSAFSVQPSTIQVGDSAFLSWATVNATTCTASGGTGSWSGSEPTSSLGTSTGTINAAGTYSYTLTCSGTDNVNTSSVVTLNVTSAPPPTPAITSFKASPSSLLTNQSTLLSWTTTSATACAGLGGTGTDGWVAAQPASDAGLSIGPFAAPGVYVYTLTCTGPGGTSAPSAVTVDVTSSPPTPVIAAFALVPTTVQTGQSVLATWASLNATSCTASGGTAGDGWSGSVPTTSVGTTIGPINATGNVTYTLTCTGAGGPSAPSSQTISVTASAPPATITTFLAVPTAIQVGQSALLSWVTGNATSCAATGGTGSDGWNGSKPTLSVGTSTGVISTAGVYTYTLTCSGAGGTSTPATAQVTVTNVAPPANIVSLTALPNTLQVGQSTSLSWVTSGASACSASGGTGSDGWGGSVATTGVADLVGPFNSPGTYVYTLICTGAGGTSAPTSTSVTVNQLLPAASIVSFTATPSTATVGNPISLAWTTLNATSCTASGGSGSDGWSGAVGTLSLADIVNAPASAGTVTYTLTCTGSGGTSAPTSVNVIVTAAAPLQPTVALKANATNPAQVQPGGAISLSWSSAYATSCTASGGAGGWAGTQPINSSGVTVTPITTPGTYTYTITCSGLGGSGSSSVQVTVMSSSSYDCGIPGLATTALVTPAASVTTSSAGICVLGCTVSGAGNVIDNNPANYATIGIPLGVAGSVTLNVTDNTTFPAGRQVGVVLTNGGGLINLSLLGGVTLQTLLNGTVQDTATTAGLLSLQAAGLISVDTNAGFATFTTTKPFNAVQVVSGSLVSLGSTVKVYSACVSLH